MIYSNFFLNPDLQVNIQNFSNFFQEGIMKKNIIDFIRNHLLLSFFINAKIFLFTIAMFLFTKPALLILLVLLCSSDGFVAIYSAYSRAKQKSKK